MSLSLSIPPLLSFVDSLLLGSQFLDFFYFKVYLERKVKFFLVSPFDGAYVGSQISLYHERIGWKDDVIMISTLTIQASIFLRVLIDRLENGWCFVESATGAGNCFT